MVEYSSCIFVVYIYHTNLDVQYIVQEFAFRNEIPQFNYLAALLRHK